MNSIIKIKKPLTLFLALSTFAIVMTGCGQKEEVEVVPEATAVPIATATPAPEPSATPVPDANMLNGIPIIGEREVVNGKMQSYLTGEWKEEAVVTRRPIAVMVPNNTPALPQYGLSQASIIYEAPVEGRITRLMPIFEDFDDLDHIGPIRSSRDYYIYVAAGYEAIYCNWGLAIPYVEELINSDVIDNVSAAVKGIHNPASGKTFDRITRSGYSSEFTGYLFIDGLKKDVERLGYDWDYSENYVPQFIFAADDTRVEYTDQKDASMIYPGGKEDGNKGGYGAYNPYFEYHEDDHLYYRYQSGKKQIDELNGEQYAVSNVVLQYCHGEVRDDHDYLAFGVHGEGDALIFTNGKVIEGTWSRYDGDGTPAKYFDKDGNEIVVNQGKTWICNVWKEYGEFVLYE